MKLLPKQATALIKRFRQRPGHQDHTDQLIDCCHSSNPSSKKTPIKNTNYFWIYRSILVSVVAGLFFTGLAIGQKPEEPQGQERRVYGKNHPFKIEELPEGKLKEKLKTLDPQARGKAMKWLHTFNFAGIDAVESLRTDDDGAIYYICSLSCAACKSGEHDKSSHDEPSPDTSGALEAEPTEPKAGENTVPEIAAAPVSISAPPVYNSKPGAPNHIYLDFNGGVITGKQWNTSYGVASWTAKAYSSDGDLTTFSDAEQAFMRNVWERTAEDYAPFNINVTTDVAYDPDNTGGLNNVAWNLFCPRVAAVGGNLPHAGYGGIAYVGVFGNSDFASRYQPAFTKAETNESADIAAEAGSHEVGHNMGLSHDTRSNEGYYGGHAGAGAPTWGPIMGTGYGRNVSQWSKGEYYDSKHASWNGTSYVNNANTNDDLLIISNRTGYRVDGHGNTFGAASALTSGTVNQAGIIERTSDIDAFTFNHGGGSISLNAATYKSATSTWGGNLDILLELYDVNQVLIASNNSATLVNASLSVNVPAGRYYVMVKPSSAGNATGTGSPYDSVDSTRAGYTVYASLGQYTLTGSFVPEDGILITSPVGGEAWVAGLTYPITWGSAMGGNVKIELFKGGSLHSTLAATTPNDGSFNWAIPSGITLANDYKVKITSIEQPTKFDQSSLNFTITNDPLAAALDTTNLAWSTNGNLPWFSQTTTTFDTVDAAQSGAITHSQTSSLETTIAGPGTLTFYWKVSSEAGYDFLRFYINNSEQAAIPGISGEVGWVQKTVSIPAGNQTIKWTYSKDGSVDSGSNAAWVDQVVFTAGPSTYSVAYNGNGNSAGTPPVDSNQYNPGAIVTVLPNSGNLSKTGFTFAGWNTAADGGGTQYNPGNTFIINSNVTLYARWLPTYTVTYNGNGNNAGTPPVDANQYNSGATVTVLPNSGNLSKIGFNFAGWNTAANGSGTQYNPGNTFTINSNVTLYAQWASAFTVTYNGNGNNGGSPPVDSNQYAPGSTVTVLANTGNLTKSGHTFTGWNTAPNGGGTHYNPGNTFTINSNVTLYAHWLDNITPNPNPMTWAVVPFPGTAAQGAAVILGTDFTGRTVNGAVASNITWETNGIANPGDLTTTAGYALFNKPAAQGYFAPDRDLSVGSWTTIVPIAPSTEITIGNIVLDYQHFTKAGGLRNQNRTVNWTIVIEGSVSGLIATKNIAGVSSKNGTETAIFTEPLRLNATETYSMSITASSGDALENYTAISRLVVNGTVGSTGDPQTEISMTATTATDVNGVEYYFTETSGNPGGSDSGWQDSPSYKDTGLTPATQYTYNVRARDKSPQQNTTAASVAASATTLGNLQLDHFTISGIGSSHVVGVPITGITITAKTATNQTVTSFTGTVSYGGTAGITGNSANFVNGVLSNVSLTPINVGSGRTLTVTDGAGHNGLATFDVLSLYDSWSGSLNKDLDSNGDGINNGMAWALGAADPTADATGLMPTLAASATHFIYTYRRNDEVLLSPEATLNMQYGTNIVDWINAVAGTNVTITVTNDFYGAEVDRVEVRVNLNQAPNGKLFGRLKLDFTPTP